MSENTSSEKEIEFYVLYYSRFSRRYDSYVRERSRIVARCLTEWTDINCKDVLDFGVGTASVWEEINKMGLVNLSVMGIDIVDAMLEVARRKEIPWLQLGNENVETYTEKKKYDLVVASSVIRHLPDPAMAVEKANHLLKDDGEFLVEEQTLGDSHYVILPKVTNEIEEYWIPSSRNDSFMKSEEELLDIISDSGFRRKRYEEFSYEQKYDTFEEIKDMLVNDTMWGMSYQEIEDRHRKKCDDTLLRVLRDQLHDPILHRRIFVCLLQK